ncbi:hypothetical protein [Histidinibacterium lentulum]|uniref:Uncharacterized protein n=1 Tax=Histidinibacterium lentulum TaxID=2480588 RepID=A0A3N2R8L7_9RHOB|nr:hypothetical protein [Histidinibacterium lentulum]ROU03814.1 hypothetical protein EAT49_03820 [Histidinibacterium lentulum]
MTTPAHPAKLTTLYIRSCAIGFAASAVFVGLLIWGDVARLGHLVTHSADGLLALGLLWLFNGIVFAGVQFGIAIMALKSEDEHDGGQRQPEPVAAPVLIPVRTDDRR